MHQKSMKKIYLYSKFERFWHWFQAVTIILLLLTGFEIHGSFELLGFMGAVDLHNTVGLLWLGMFFFFVFWMFVTHEYKQYIPTTKKLFEVVRYYSSGIFKGEDHPVHKSLSAKHNPMQRLTYLGLTAILLPFQMVTGFLYWGYNNWADWGLSFLSLRVVAVLHLIGGFALLIFLIIHVYMTTTGHSVTAHVAAMFSGWEEVPEDFEVEEWEKKSS
ncbi:cytochrome B [Pseudodesulfovibrio sp. JC047]|uniref:cytochrome b/b6 domain-containing protein n=1 Tax=Pseudodesulfovibrio sp. JC047 TaxID=2683199 RepID=UPI0013D1D4F2|nr:cytochrome b/b6 domain-containing protein [Pseudodesulfovibrio sp. JC047]NDV18209.1 cytochrome B [Pseudodesulfovibrio sp. JC047]